MEPIVLNEFGETLLEYPDSNTKDTKNLFGILDMKVVENVIGVHKFCRGFVDIIPVSATHNVIHCRRCGRITSPITYEVDTFGKLRNCCADEIARKKNLAERIENGLWHAIHGPTEDGPVDIVEMDALDRDVETFP
jgi:hypothetical protein